MRRIADCPICARRVRDSANREAARNDGSALAPGPRWSQLSDAVGLQPQLRAMWSGEVVDLRVALGLLRLGEPPVDRCLQLDVAVHLVA
jgi:hypothetical protein